MATYKSAIGETSAADLCLLELDVYGSQRLGVLSVDQKLADLPEPGTPIKTMEKGNKHFELVNHLGNILSVISDRLFSTQSTTSGKVARYTADLVSSSDYYPFGMQMPGRKVDSGKYRFGFNGQEKEGDITGSETHNTAEYWMYDTRLGRRWEVDPLSSLYSFQSPYAAFNNNPIFYADPLGLEGNPTTHKVQEGETLTSIAKKHNVTTEEIIKANSTLDWGSKRRHGKQNWVFINEKLSIPGNEIGTVISTSSGASNTTGYTADEFDYEENRAKSSKINYTDGGYYNGQASEPEYFNNKFTSTSSSTLEYVFPSISSINNWNNGVERIQENMGYTTGVVSSLVAPEIKVASIIIKNLGRAAAGLLSAYAMNNLYSMNISLNPGDRIVIEQTIQTYRSTSSSGGDVTFSTTIKVVNSNNIVMSILAQNSNTISVTEKALVLYERNKSKNVKITNPNPTVIFCPKILMYDK